MSWHWTKESQYTLGGCYCKGDENVRPTFKIMEDSERSRQQIFRMPISLHQLLRKYGLHEAPIMECMGDPEIYLGAKLRKTRLEN
eukprot:15365068-Ditylum_brightwellii.AAC.1